MRRGLGFAAVTAALGLSSVGFAAFEKGGALDDGPRSAAMGGAPAVLADHPVTVRMPSAGLARTSGEHAQVSLGVATRASLSTAVVGGGGLVEGLGVAAYFAQTSLSEAHERTYGLSVGIPFEEIPWLSFGAALKSLGADFKVDRASGTALDVSALARFPLPWSPDMRLNVLVAVEDVIGKLDWSDGPEEELDSQARFGFGWRWRESLSILAEARIVRGRREAEVSGSLGAEQRFRFEGHALAARLGWRDGGDRESAFSGGLGGRVKNFSLDYGLIGMPRSQGTLHVVSVSWMPGETRRVPPAAVARIRRLGPKAVTPQASTVRLTSPFETIRFDIDPPRVALRVRSWALLVLDGSGRAVWTLEGEGLPPGRAVWSTAMDDGRFAPTGRYASQLLLRGPGAYQYMSGAAEFRIVRDAEAGEPVEPPGEREFDRPLKR